MCGKTKRDIAGIIGIFLAVILILTAMPVATIQAAEGGNGLISTDKTKYAINEPIIVTATEGAWVGVWKRTNPDEDPSQNAFFYAFDVDGEPHNIYDGEKGARGASFVASVPGPMDLKVVLFGDEGTDNILDQANIHVNSTTHTSSLSVASDYTVGDPVEINATSDERDAWVGIYQGTFTIDDTFSDKGIDDFYVCYAQNQGKAIEDLEAGDYSAVLFKNSKYSVDKVVNFTVHEQSEPVTYLATDKDTYESEEQVYVSTNYSTEGAWVGLYEQGAAYDPADGGVDPLYRYALSNKQPQVMNIKEGTAVRPDDYTAGDYSVVLFGDAGYNNVIATKDISVYVGEKGTVEIEEGKTKFRINDPIRVKGEGGQWIGVYKSAENPKEHKDGYFYRVPSDGEFHNIYAGQAGNRSSTFTASIPGPMDLKVVLFGDEGYNTILDQAIIHINSTTHTSSLSTDKDQYDDGDPVRIQATSDERDAWVGVYSGVFSSEDAFDEISPVEQFYVAHKDNEGGTINNLKSGVYTVVLFYTTYPNNVAKKYNVIQTSQFIYGDNGAALSTDKDIYETGSAIYVTTFYPGKGWVGLYLKKEWNDSHTEYSPLYKYELASVQPQSTNILETTAVRPNDFVGGDYVLVLFEGSGTSQPVATKEITVKDPDTAVLTEASCEGYGYQKVTRADGTSKYIIIEPLGHDFGDWTFDAEHLTHTRVCSRDSSHTESEWCSFDDGKIIEEATELRPGVKQFTCQVCGGTYTEKYELEGETIERYSGQDRYQTSVKIAEQLKKSLSVDRFDAVILADGRNYPDALSGAFLAAHYGAPILLVRDNDKDLKPVTDFVNANLSENGTVYILGGTGAVSKKVENKFNKYRVDRVSGKTRYETNYEILSKVDIGNSDILICTGGSYADSLSASAVNRPIMLVKDKLTDAQIAFLKAHKDNKFYIIGGTGAVSKAVEEQVSKIHESKRLAGSTRYETSVMIAKEFFEDASATVLAYGENFPDGLCGGPLAIAEKTPLILTKSNKKDLAKEYCAKYSVTKAGVLGGEALISDETARYILADSQGGSIAGVNKITYYLNGGVNTTDNPVTYTDGEEIKLVSPHKTNYVFDGWYTDSSFRNLFDGSAASGDLSLYAKWKEAPLDITVTGMENMIWSWWYSPQVLRADGKVFWGFAENGGYSGVAQYDTKSGNTKKTFVKKVDSVDDHNGVAITFLDDGRILSSFAGGHNKDNLIHIRISNDPYDVENFDKEIILKSKGKTCYSQILHYNNMIYLFYRVNNNSWAFRSTKDGITWSDEKILVTAPEQYYCKFVQTTEAGLFRVLMYSNPTGSDPNIRMGFFDAQDAGMEALLNSDGEYLGMSDVSYTEFNILIERPSGLAQRLFDVAVTDPASPKILYTTFNTSTLARNSEYYLYNSGTVTKICEGGNPLMNSKYQLGAMFAGNNKIILARNEDRETDYVELYSIKGNTVSLERSIYSENTEGSIRNARPISDADGTVVLWHRGYYNEKGYTDFETEARIHFLQ